MEFERSSGGEDETDGGSVGNRDVGEGVVTAELLAVAADDEACLIAEDIAVAVTFYFEDPFGRNGLGSWREGRSNDELPALVVLERLVLFGNGLEPVVFIWGRMDLGHVGRHIMVRYQVWLRGSEDPCFVA